MILETHMQLFGPQPQGYQFVPGIDYNAPGANFSASTKPFRFDQTMPRFKFISWELMALPSIVHSVLLRWHYFVEGESVFETIAELHVDETPAGPRPYLVDITPRMLEIRSAGRYGFVSNWIKGNGVVPFTLHESRISTGWRVGYYG